MNNAPPTLAGGASMKTVGEQSRSLYFAVTNSAAGFVLSPAAGL
jgi:hypothetical protein